MGSAELTGRRGTPASRGSRHAARVAAGFMVSWGLFGALLGMYWLTTDGEHLKVRVMTVLTGSMRPTLGVGDVVLAEVVPAHQIQAGDIVTYREPSGERYVTHRVQSIQWLGSQGTVVTRGDANDVGESWVVPENGDLGRVAFHLPYLGYLVGALGTSVGRWAVVGVALVLGAYALLLIWRPRREDVTKQVLDQYASSVWFAAVAATGGTDADQVRVAEKPSSDVKPSAVEAETARMAREGRLTDA